MSNSSTPKNLKLTIELVPRSSWYRNLRTMLPRNEWTNIRRKIYSKYEYKCSICGESGKLHCHEVWEYDDEKHIQRLTNLISVCENCHSVKHFGYSLRCAADGLIDIDKLIAHFMNVNEVDRQFFESYLSQQFSKWKERSNHSWSVDISNLKSLIS